MADYKTIHGTTIKSYTTDPDNIIEDRYGMTRLIKYYSFKYQTQLQQVLGGLVVL